VLRRRLTITGSTLRPRPVAFKAAIAQSLKQHVWPLIEAGRIKPVIHSTFKATDTTGAEQAASFDGIKPTHRQNCVDLGCLR